MSATPPSVLIAQAKGRRDQAGDSDASLSGLKDTSVAGQKLERSLFLRDYVCSSYLADPETKGFGEVIL
jgi:hypothetical protein